MDVTTKEQVGRARHHYFAAKDRLQAEIFHVAEFVEEKGGDAEGFYQEIEEVLDELGHRIAEIGGRYRP